MRLINADDLAFARFFAHSITVANADGERLSVRYVHAYVEWQSLRFVDANALSFARLLAHNVIFTDADCERINITHVHAYVEQYSLRLVDANVLSVARYLAHDIIVTDADCERVYICHLYSDAEWFSHQHVNANAHAVTGRHHLAPPLHVRNADRVPLALTFRVAVVVAVEHIFTVGESDTFAVECGILIPLRDQHALCLSYTDGKPERDVERLRERLAVARVFTHGATFANADHEQVRVRRLYTDT